MDMSRRGFIQFTGAGLAASSLGALGFGFAAESLAASVRPFKLAATTETRNTCTYCSVACGILIYSLGDRAKNARSDIIHIEGDPRSPHNEGTLCPKGAAIFQRACVSAEFRALASNESSPVTKWLRSLARFAHGECGGPGAGTLRGGSAARAASGASV